MDHEKLSIYQESKSRETVVIQDLFRFIKEDDL